MSTRGMFIDGQWREGAGSAFRSIDPGSGDVVWEGASAGAAEIEASVAAARKAWESWAELPIQQRILYLQHFAEQLTGRRAELSEAISRETGKPRWEAGSEVESMIEGKS